MRPLSLLLTTSMLVLSSSALAQNAAYPSPDAESVSTVQVRAPLEGRWIDQEQASQLAGAYALSNGWHLDVRPESRYIMAAIDKQRPMLLVQVAQDRFVSRNGSVTMEFNRGETGDDMLLRYVPDLRLGQVVELSARMAQR